VKRIREASWRIDYFLIITVAALLIVGLMMVYSSTFDLAYKGFGDPAYFFRRQILWMVLGLGALIVLARIEYQFWQRVAILLMAGALLLLGVVLVFGNTRFGGQRWLLPGGSVQPSELCKLAVVIYIAAWLSSKGERIRQITYGLIPFSILIGLVTGLIMFQPDLSTAVLIALTGGAMFFIAGADLLQLAISLIFGGATFVFLVSQLPHSATRIAVFLDPNSDPNGIAYHIRQTLIALGCGGWTGVGLGAGRQKFGYMPAAHTDAIFAVLGEELGLIGCLVVIGLFVALAYRGFKIALEAPDAFGTVLAAGLTCSLIIQALVNIAVVTATLPYAGVPLPFISYGGSSLVVALASVGLLLSISRGKTKKRRMGARARDNLGRRDWRARVSRVGHR
ncbi:MAG: putative lipid II flippase FtsW, partial [Anaerolineae bacterium]|nr:putative lipid II flippase FtsW [Anaerolineae bacterium]